MSRFSEARRSASPSQGQSLLQGGPGRHPKTGKTLPGLNLRARLPPGPVLGQARGAPWAKSGRGGGPVYRAAALSGQFVINQGV